VTGEDASELRWVRAASCGAACCVAAAVLLIAALPVSTRVSFDTLPAAHAVLITEAPRALNTPEVQQEVSPGAVALARSATNAADAPSPRLWTYSPSGQIVFAWPEQYERCVRARSRGSSEADCPDPNETRQLVLRDGAQVSFDLRTIVLASGD
jgi:hypothetical protein